MHTVVDKNEEQTNSDVESSDSASHLETESDEVTLLLLMLGAVAIIAA